MHLLSANQINIQQLENLFKEVDFIKNDATECARGKILAIVKNEGSTRTRVSFEVAMKRLGGKVVNIPLEGSSVSKGETLEDTINTVSRYADVILMRHSQKGVIHTCSSHSKVPVINGGDGDGEHPTQALLDIYTIYKECNQLNNLNIMVVGDLKHSRTVHSLLYLLSLYPDNLVHLVSPEDMQIPEEYKRSNIKYIHHVKLSDALKLAGSHLNILYMTRLQKERHDKDFNDTYYCLNNVEYLNATCSVLHPLPRNGEIPVSFDSDVRAAYFDRQLMNGLNIRMALLGNLFKKNEFLPLSTV